MIILGTREFCCTSFLGSSYSYILGNCLFFILICFLFAANLKIHNFSVLVLFLETFLDFTHFNNLSNDSFLLANGVKGGDFLKITFPYYLSIRMIFILPVLTLMRSLTKNVLSNLHS